MFWIIFFFDRKNSGEDIKNADVEKLLSDYSAFIKKCVRSTVIRNERLMRVYDWEDLFQEAEIAFLKARDSYDGVRGVGFATYASNVIRNHMLSLMRRKSVRALNQEEPETACVLTSDSEDDICRKPALDDRYAVNSALQDVEFLADYGPLLELICSYIKDHPLKKIRYGMAAILYVFQGSTLVEAAKALGISKSYITICVREARMMLSSDRDVRLICGKTV